MHSSLFLVQLKRALLPLFALLVSGLIFAQPVLAQDEPKKPETEKKQEEPEEKKTEEEKPEKESADEKEEKKEKKKNKKLIKDLIKDYDKLDGLFTLYRNPETGDIQMEVRADQLGKEFIYFSHVTDGVVESGHFRGQFRRQKVFKIERRYKRLAFIEVNPFFYFDPDSPLARAKSANISEAVISTNTIQATDEDETRFVVATRSLFLSEAFDQIKPSNTPGAQPGQRFQLGKFSRGKSQITNVHTYPENISIEVDYVYTNPAPVNRGSWFDVTDARNVTVSVQHTLVEMPENDYKPRFDDARVGYFLDYVNDQTDQSATPWRDMINRWHLVKKDPNAEVSEPVEPIVWWIENTTPVNLRPTIKAAVEAWNIAFEQAGFKNAVVAKIQPDDAEWDAGDIRYNVLRWTSSPRPPFGGYGPSFSNPRTGQILAADIMLEYSFLTNRVNAGAIFETTAIPQHSAEEEAQSSFLDQLRHHSHTCEIGSFMQLNTMLGKTLAATLANQSDFDANDRLIKESLYYLILHEVGHTLGLNHNMKATQSRSYETTHDIAAQEAGLVTSVMDYPSINFAPPGETQAHYYNTKPGAYDIWAIQFGYDPDLDDEEARTAHLARSTEKDLVFANDADDMRAPGRGIDPRVNVFDMTDDAIQFAEDRLKMANNAMGKLKQKFTQDGSGYQELRNAYLILTGDMAWQGRVASRYIGGVYVDRAVAGQEGATAPYRPVEERRQRQAMQLIRKYILGPDAFSIDPSLIQHLAIQRRGFFHGAGTEDPKIHGRIAAIQADILNHILHPTTMLRMTDSGLYGNGYSLTEVLNDLTAAVFEDDSRSAVNSHRQELQIMYVKALINILNRNDFHYIARSNAFSNLKSIRGTMTRWRGNSATRAHRDHITFLINKALEVVTD